MGHPRIDILPGAYLMAALLLLLLPLGWIVSWAAAAMVHELFHIFVISLCGGTIRQIRIGSFGAEIEIGYMSPFRELLCALAGPAGGLLMLLLFRWLPLMSALALLQSVCNLLPVYPLDGGRALRCVLEMTAGEDRAEKISGIINRIVPVFMLLIAVWACIYWKLGYCVLLPPLLLSIKYLPRKIPCKRRGLGLQ